MSEVFLEPNDGLAEAKRKIDAASGKEVLVSLPSGTRLRNPLSLKLLMREAATRGKAVRFVSEDKALKNVLASLSQGSGPPPGKPPETKSSFVVGYDVARDVTPQVSEPPKSRKRRFSIPYKARWLGVGFGVLVGGGLLVGGFLFLFQRVHKASIRLVVKPEGLVKSFEVSASPQIETIDPISKKIPAQVHEYYQKGSETTKASGTDVVGEKARGVVTIYNKTDEDREFSKGAKLTLGKTEGEDLIYYLEDAVVVPKRTAVVSTEGEPGQEVVTYTYGKADVEVVAADIGEDYNIKKKEKFTVEDLPISEFIVENEDPIKGGSKKEVTVVSQADYDRLEASLTQRLSEELRSRIESELQGDNVVDPNAVETVVVSRVYDQPLGGVATEVTLTMEMKGVAYAYSQEDLEELLRGALGGFVPERFVLTDSTQSIAVEGLEVQNGELTFFAKVRGQAIPRIDVEKLKEAVRGKRLEVAQAYLGSLGVVSYYEIELSPKLPPAFQVLPKDVNKIEVVIDHESQE